MKRTLGAAIGYSSGRNSSSPSLQGGILDASNDHMKITGLLSSGYALMPGTGSASKCWVSLMILQLDPIRGGGRKETIKLK